MTRADNKSDSVTQHQVQGKSIIITIIIINFIIVMLIILLFFLPL